MAVAEFAVDGGGLLVCGDGFVVLDAAPDPDEQALHFVFAITTPDPTTILPPPWSVALDALPDPSALDGASG